METKLDIAKRIIRGNYYSHDCGIFNTRNKVGDPMRIIYNGDDLRIEVCDSYAYFEVFGLSKEEFAELRDYYDNIR